MQTALNRIPPQTPRTMIGNSFFRRVGVIALLLMGSLFSVCADEPNPLLTPQQALARFSLPPGFTADLLKAEPDLVQPIAYCWDEHGRLWVVEGNTYPQRAGQPPVPRPDEDPHLDKLNPEELANLLGGNDRILIFSDEDGDGTYETRKVFMEHLNLVSGIEVGFGGVYIGAAPYLLHIPIDASGDKPAGAPRVLADGFGWHDTHETLNSFIWGPDGWLYGCHGVFTHSQVRVCTGPAGPRPRTPMNCAYWRWHPVRQEFEVFAQGTSNPWGLDYNSKGQFFAEACVIPHFWHIIQGAYYLRQSNPLGHFNPYVYNNIDTIADHSHFVGNQWSAARDISNEAGGGHAHCGLCVYQGDNFPPEYRDRPLFGNIHGKRINQEQLLPEGSGYKASHLPDFFKANDFNFTAVTIKAAPDGSLVFSDWYDRQKCHTSKSEIWDRSNGRLYRVRYEGWKPWHETAGMWDATSTLDLQFRSNGWLNRMARRCIEEAAAKAPVDAALITRATALLLAEPSPEVRLRLMWWLHATNDPANAKLWLRLLKHPDAAVRQWAIQLSLELKAPAQGFLNELRRMAIEESAAPVRLAIASALQRLPFQQRWDIARALLQHTEDASDHNLPQMLWYAIEPAVPEDPAQALALLRDSRISLPARLIARRLAETQSTTALDLLLTGAAEAKDPAAALLYMAPLADALKGRFHLEQPPHWKAAYETTSRLLITPTNAQDAAALDDVRLALAAAFDDIRAWPELRALARNSANPFLRRQSALQTLAAAKDPALGEMLLALLTDSSLRLDAFRQGASLSASENAEQSPSAQFFRAVLAQYVGYSSEEKSAAILALAGRATTARQLLDAVAAKRIPHTDIPVFAARQIAGLNDPALTELLEKHWGLVRTGDKDATATAAAVEHARLKKILTPGFLKTADLAQGRLLFKNICGQCHQLFGEGAKIGPDLTGSNRADLDYILENVTNPNAIIGKDYELHTFTLKDGQVISGMVRQENATAITVQTLGAEEQLRRADVKSEEKPGISMMPAGIFSALSNTQMRDLTAYLASPRQVGLPGAPTPAAYKVDGALEGESLNIVSKTGTGIASPQAMAHFKDGAFSGDSQLFWRGAKPGDVLELAVPIKTTGRYKLKAVFCRAPDYAVVRLQLDKKGIQNGQFDLFGSKVSNTPVLELCELDLSEGEHLLGIEITGANPAAKPSYMVGLDYLLVEPVIHAQAKE